MIYKSIIMKVNLLSGNFFFSKIFNESKKKKKGPN